MPIKLSTGPTPQNQRVIYITPSRWKCNTPDHEHHESALDRGACSIATRTSLHTASADTSHCALTHLGESGASLLMLMAKSRHKKAENVRKYFHPSPEAIAEVTGLLAPGDSRR